VIWAVHRRAAFIALSWRPTRSGGHDSRSSGVTMHRYAWCVSTSLACFEFRTCWCRRRQPTTPWSSVRSDLVEARMYRRWVILAARRARVPTGVMIVLVAPPELIAAEIDSNSRGRGRCHDDRFSHRRPGFGGAPDWWRLGTVGPGPPSDSGGQPGHGGSGRRQTEPSLLRSGHDRWPPRWSAKRCGTTCGETGAASPVSVCAAHRPHQFTAPHIT
jgi:hypothetical protein